MCSWAVTYAADIAGNPVDCTLEWNKCKVNLEHCRIGFIHTPPLSPAASENNAYDDTGKHVILDSSNIACTLRLNVLYQ